MIDNIILFNNPNTTFLLTILFYFIGATLSITLPKRQEHKNHLGILLTYTPAIIASSFAIILSLTTIITGNTTRLTIQNVLPFIDFEIKIDSIASFFIFILGIVSFSISLYSIGYSRLITTTNKDKDDNKKQNIAVSSRSFGFLFNIFILSMMLVVVSDNAFFFLFFWEIMSLTSFLFIILNDNKGISDSQTNSGLGYLIMTHVGTAFIIALFMVMFSQTGSFSFDSITKSLSSATTTQITTMNAKNLVFILGFIGFGIKAGMIPFHAWIPRSYPIVPSNISALMSGAMINMAVYGLVRMLLDLNSTGTSPDYAWWGTIMIAAGSASAVIGVLYAVISNDMRRTIAFSSVENIGIIFIGLGLSTIFRSYGLVNIYNLAILASMLHTANHAFFKSLLFMGAGSVESRTHTTNMENLGGLVKNMPYTSLIFLIGSISIAGLPPFNGFVSEWLTMQSLLFTSEVPSAILKISLGFASLAFALAIGTSAAVFLKVFGISFLGRARSNLSRAAREVPKVMLFSKAILGILCIVFGIIPSTGINLISYAFDLKSTHAALFGAIELQKNTKHNFSSLSMPAVVVMLTSLGVAVTAFLFIIGRRKSGAAVKKETKPMTTTETIPSSLEPSSSLPAPNATTSASKAAPTWYSGYSDVTDTKNQYSAAAFSQPIQVVFKILYRTKTRIIKTYYSEANPYIKKSIKVESKTIDIFENFFYAPIIFASIFTLDKIRKIQTGKINAYLLYIMITVILLLVAVRAGF